MKNRFEASTVIVAGLVMLLVGCATSGQSAFSSQPELMGKTFRTLVCRLGTPEEAKAYRERMHSRKYLPDETTFVSHYQMVGTRGFSDKEGRLITIAAIEKYPLQADYSIGDIVDVVYEEPRSKEDFANGAYPHVVRVVCSHDDVSCLDSPKGSFRGEVTPETPI